ncbi:MAG: hypothetical protein Q8K60_05415 [Parachlamydiaceae bacterium]|nr:hypothetical protein [Parachlamydiaceae bacterium]
MHFLIEYLKNFQVKTLDDNGRKTIGAIFSLASPENLIQFESSLFDLFQIFLNELEFNDNITINEKTSHYIYFDRIFTDKKISILVKSSPMKWRMLFLIYLKNAEKSSYKERGPQLWVIFENTLKISNSKYKKQLISLYECLANLLNNSSPPPKEIVNWIQKSGQDIFVHLHHHHEFEISKALLKYIMEANLSVSYFEDYVWKACVNDQSLIDQCMIELFLFSNPKKLQSSISFKEYPVLLPIFNHLLNFHPLHSVTMNWMNWFIEKQEFFDSNHLFDLSLKYTEILLKKPLYLNAFKFISQLVFQEINQRTQIDLYLWSTLEKLIPTSSKQELTEILSFKNLLNKKREVPISTSKLILEKYCKDKSCSEQDLNLIMHLLQSVQTPELSLWMTLWSQLDRAEFTENIHKIISESWEIQKTFAKTPNHHPQFIEYWDYLSRCLKKIEHPDLVNLLDDVNFFWDSKIHSKGYSTLKQILLMIVSNTIKQMDLNQFDPKQLKTIYEKQSILSTQLFKNSKNKIHESKKWDKLIEIVILDHLTNSSNPLVIQECCLRLQSKFQEFSQTNLPDSQCLNWIESELQSIGLFFQNQLTVDENLFKVILSLCINIAVHPYVPVQTLLNCINHLNSVFTLQKCFFLSVVDRGNSNEIQKFKYLFFKMISKDLESQNYARYQNYIDWINTFKNYCSFSTLEQELIAQIAYRLFNLNDENTSSEVQNLIEKTNSFYYYAPHFISNLSLLEKAVNTILEDLIVLKTIPKKDIEKDFTYIIERMLDFAFLIPYLSKNTPTFLNNYDQIIFKHLYEQFNEDFEIIEICFYNYVQKWLQRSQHHPELIKNAIQVIETHAFFFPPVFKFELDNFLTEDPKIKHWKNYQLLLDTAVKQDLFKDCPGKLIVLQLLDDQQDWSKFKHIKLEQIEIIITKFCSYGAVQPYAICRAADLLKVFLILSIKFKAKWNKSLNSNFQNVLTALDRYNPNRGKFGRVNRFFLIVNTVFDYLEETNYIEFSSHFAKLFYPHSLKLINELYNDSKNVKTLIKALMIHLRIISKEMLQKQIPNIINKIEKIFPMIKKSIFLGNLEFENSNQIVDTRLINLIQLFVKIILDPVQDVDKKNYQFIINDAWNHNKKTLLTKWYYSLFTLESAHVLLESKSFGEIQANTVFLSWIIILSKNKGCLLWFNYEEAYGTLLKNCILQNIEQEKTLSKKLALKSLYLFFHTHPNRRLTDFHLLNEIMDVDEESFLNEDPRQIVACLQILLFVFFQWENFQSHSTYFYDFPIYQQEFFEKFLLKIKNIFSHDSITSSKTIKVFLKKMTFYCFESQRLKLERKAGLEFITWVYSYLNLTEEELSEVPFPLLHLTYTLYSSPNAECLNTEFSFPPDSYSEFACYVASTQFYFNSSHFIRIIINQSLPNI